MPTHTTLVHCITDSPLGPKYAHLTKNKEFPFYRNAIRHMDVMSTTICILTNQTHVLNIAMKGRGMRELEIEATCTLIRSHSLGKKVVGRLLAG